MAEPFHARTALFLGIGVVLAFAVNATLSSFLDPILATTKLSVSVAA